ncbi:MAG: hypothetical protein SOT28_01185 [Fusicatenibacter sp.]|nr:hypothetical protein [Lachnospiraceae bacterium]MDY2936920.1 hypothetical protein [Fusicatenibacter sp.]
METTKNCPGCSRNCELSAPHCERGVEFAKTGVLPEKHGHGSMGHLQFEKKEQQLVMKYLHHAVAAADQGGFTQEMAAEMFAVLTDEETADLMKLLEKLSDHWMNIAPEKPSHGGKHHR